MENIEDPKEKNEPLLRTSGGQDTTLKLRTTILYSRKSTTTNRIVNAKMWNTNTGAIWAIFSLLMQNMPEIYTVYIISNYGSPIMVAGAGLGVMFINMLVYGVFEGMNGAIDTLVSQYFGSGDLLECNYVFNKARVINSIVYIPVATLLFFSNHLLDILNQPQEVSYYARLYLVIQIPGLYWIVQYDTLRRYLQAQGCFDMPTKLLWATFVFHVVFVTTVTHIVNQNPLVVWSMATNITLFLDLILLLYFSKKYTSFFNLFFYNFQDLIL